MTVTAEGPARVLLLGGTPFEEDLVMWWNFVGRSHEDIAEARTDWAAGRRFGPVGGYPGEPLPAPGAADDPAAAPSLRWPGARTTLTGLRGHRTGGPTHHELGRAPHGARRPTGDDGEQQVRGDPALPEQVLADRGQRRVGVRGLVDPVEADHREVARHRDAELRRGVQAAEGEDVGDAEDRGRAVLDGTLQQRPDAARAAGPVVGGDADDRHLRALGTPASSTPARKPCTRFCMPPCLVTDAASSSASRTTPSRVEASVGQGRGEGDRHDGEPSVPERDEVLGQPVRGADVVDPDVGDAAQPEAP